VDLLRWQLSIDDEVAIGVGVGEGQEVFADGTVEVVGFGLETVVDPSPTGPADLRRQVDEHSERRQQTTGGPQVEVTHLVDPEVTPGALIGDQRSPCSGR